MMKHATTARLLDRTSGSKRRPWCVGLLGGLAAFALAFGLAGAAPTAAFAGVEESAQDWAAAVEASESPAYAPYTSASAALQTYSDSASASTNPMFKGASISDTKFDLRDYGVVTPVKFQNPWGTCWGFAAIAASETSLLSEMGKTYQDTKLDLSERQFAYYSYIPVPVSTVNKGEIGCQTGEGAYSNVADDLNYMFNMGGLARYATTVFSAGIGPVCEEDVPYRSEEGAIRCLLEKDNEEPTRQTLSLDGIVQKEKDGYTVTKLYYAKDTPEGADAQWALLEENPDGSVSPDMKWWMSSLYELEESNILPEMCTYEKAANEEGRKYVGPNPEATKAVKQELLAGRAVAVSFHADTSKPGEDGKATYINENTWAHYTYDPIGTNHAVTIVGWDDDYFYDKNNQCAFVKEPPKPGAWIVKNSWGAETEEFPNANAWGVENEDGKHTGYFYISYYDQTLARAETFDFDLTPDASLSPEYIIDQYNFLISGGIVVRSSESEAPMANVFIASEGQTVRTLTCETTQPNTEVTYELYLLDGYGQDPVESPVQGDPVVTITKTYEHGGFHREMIPDAEWVPMREGQRYSVVVTQEAPDGCYYQSVAACAAKVEGREETPGRYFESRVNPGESWTYDSDSGEWADWRTVLEWVKEEIGTDRVYDNFPIKAFAEMTDYASADTLQRLAELIAVAQQSLDNTAVSADGSDVDSTKMWATEAARQQLAAAIAEAKDLLSGAGDDFNKVLLTTPTEFYVEGVLADLSAASDTYAGQLAAGTKAASETPVPKPAKGNGAFAKTADQGMAFAGMAACVATLAVAGAATARIARRRDR